MYFFIQLKGKKKRKKVREMTKLWKKTAEKHENQDSSSSSPSHSSHIIHLQATCNWLTRKMRTINALLKFIISINKRQSLYSKAFKQISRQINNYLLPTSNMVINKFA